MTTLTADVVICGAGIAGIATAYYLTNYFGVEDVLLLDERPVCSLTSDKSSECYRNWWPGPDANMIALMNRSIDLLENLAKRSGNVFNLNRRGYLYLTRSQATAAEFERTARLAASQGAGILRIHNGRSGRDGYIPAQDEGYKTSLRGADLILNQELIRKHFPYVSPEVIAALHVRRAGWLSAQQLAMYLFSQAKEHGAGLLRGSLKSILTSSGSIEGVRIEANEGVDQIDAPVLVNAAGPFVQNIAQMLGVTLPVTSALHLKTTINDTRCILPRSAPLVINADPLRLSFNEEERLALQEDPQTSFLINELPPGLHTRPEGGAGSQTILILWPYHTHPVPPVFPLPLDPMFTEVVVRGLESIIPGMGGYAGRFSKPSVDGGYYTQTPENRPLIGLLPVRGAYLIGALSGFGIMAACAAGELLAAHIAHADLPGYAPAFTLERYANPVYQVKLENWGSSGQL